MFTGLPGKYVPLREAVCGFKMLVDGGVEHFPEQAFYGVGGTDEAIKTGEEMGARNST